MKFNKSEIFLLVLSVCIFIFLMIEAVWQTGFSFKVDFNFASNLGKTLAGILSFISILLIFLNLRNQAYTFAISTLESRFFELLKFHRENVREMEYRSPESSNKNEVCLKGHKVFVGIYYEVEKALEHLNDFLEIYRKNNHFCDDNELFNNVCSESELINIRRDNSNRDKRSYTFDVIEKANIAYLIVFVGVSKQGLSVLRPILEKNYQKEFVKKLLNYFTNIPVKYSIYRESFNKDKELYKKKKYIKYFGGHQHQLGHYFRHLYQTVTYIDKLSEIPYKQKYGYIKILRAQLSTYEQAIVFFNSLSDFGLIWELDTSEDSKKLITKYNFIKNIPSEFNTTLNLVDFYPDVKFEYGNK